MLVGQFPAVITQKERLAVPAKFRRELENKLVVTKWFEGCLLLVSQGKWMSILNSLIEEPKIAANKVREVTRFVLGSAFEIDLDTQGRFVVPKILKDYAFEDNEVIFIGLLDRVEIWSKVAWTKKEKFLQVHSGEIIEKLAENVSIQNKVKES